MAQAKRIKKASKIKKKWHSIVAPKSFREQKIGETLIAEPEKAIGKTVPVNLLDLTGDMRKQNIIVKFIVTSVSGNKAQTEVTGFEMMPSFVKRMVRRGKKKIDDSFVFETSDNKKVKTKIVLVTNNLVKRSVGSTLRKSAEENLARMIKKLTFEGLVTEIIAHRLQSNLKKLLNKIYPLRVCEIRHLSIVKSKKHYDEAPKEKPKAEKKAKEEVKENPKKDEKKEEVKEAPKEEKPKKEVKPKAEEKVEEAPKEEKKAEEKPVEKKEEVKEAPKEE